MVSGITRIPGSPYKDNWPSAMNACRRNAQAGSTLAHCLSDSPALAQYLIKLPGIGQAHRVLYAVNGSDVMADTRI